MKASEIPITIVGNSISAYYQAVKGVVCAQFGSGVWGNLSYIDTLREATPQEKEHLEQCIAAGKYVDYKPLNQLKYGYQIL